VVTARDKYPLPRVVQTLEPIGTQCNYISKLDFKPASWLIPMAEQNGPKIAFIATIGLYEFLSRHRSMPFIDKNS
jgi:hypothetical protein